MDLGTLGEDADAATLTDRKTSQMEAADLSHLAFAIDVFATNHA